MKTLHTPTYDNPKMCITDKISSTRLWDYGSPVDIDKAIGNLIQQKELGASHVYATIWEDGEEDFNVQRHFISRRIETDEEYSSRIEKNLRADRMRKEHVINEDKRRLVFLAKKYIGFEFSEEVMKRLGGDSNASS